MTVQRYSVNPQPIFRGIISKLPLSMIQENSSIDLFFPYNG